MTYILAYTIMDFKGCDNAISKDGKSCWLIVLCSRTRGKRNVKEWIQTALNVAWYTLWNINTKNKGYHYTVLYQQLLTVQLVIDSVYHRRTLLSAYATQGLLACFTCNWSVCTNKLFTLLSYCSIIIAILSQPSSFIYIYKIKFVCLFIYLFIYLFPLLGHSWAVFTPSFHWPLISWSSGGVLVNLCPRPIAFVPHPFHSTSCHGYDNILHLSSLISIHVSFNFILLTF